MQHKCFLAALLSRSITRQASVWSEALKMNFNVVVCCETDELAEIVRAAVDQLMTVGAFKYLAACKQHTSDGWVTGLRGGSRSSAVEERGSAEKPVLFVCSAIVPVGLVAVRFDLPSMRSLLPGMGTIVMQVLEQMSLERYIDCFDGKTMSALKKVLDLRGVTPLLDAVIQVAYLAGVLGDEGQSQQYLDGLTSQAAMNAGQTQAPTANPQLDQILDTFMATHDPYDTLKAALAHHAFVRKKVSQAEASRNLKVSRSTLQSHLSMAERLNVARFFSQGHLGA